MFDFSPWLDLPLIWSLLIATAIFLYVLLDGFDLGVGILFPFAPSDECRDRIMHSVAPFWDGNQTWLVLGGGGLLAAFPLAYAILLPAFYIPIISMLMGLILRGVAFEFRFRANTEATRQLWTYAFHFGSLIATLCQGMMLGAFVQGVRVSGRNFSGGPFDWASAFSLMTGIALVFGYALLGATWLIMKTQGLTQAWARKVTAYALIFVGIFMGLVSLIMPMLNPSIAQFWFSTPNIYYLLPIPMLSAIFFVLITYDLYTGKSEYRPFFASMGLFLMGYLGLGLSIFPWIIPFQFDIWQAASATTSLSLMLVGVVPLLPLILGYTAYAYYVFRGKTQDHYE